nr:hypothetical protein [Tanacetum cinerariifolium]
MQTQTSNSLHNAIMEAGSKDRPPMLAPGNYIQWKSRIKRYIDTKPNREHIHYCLENPPYELGWKDKYINDAEGNLTTETHQVCETLQNVEQVIRDRLNAKVEAVQIILTGIDNDIYSTVDACPNACEMWKAIERLKQGESINPEWQRFVTLVKQSQELKHVSYHKLYDILKQHQHEVNEIRAEKIARVANPLALVAQQQQSHHPYTHPNHFNQNSSTRTHQSATRKREKAVVNSPQPIFNQEPSMVDDDDEDTSKEKEIDKLMALISLSFKKIYKPTNNNLRTSSNTSRANQDNSPRISWDLDVDDSGPIFDKEPKQKVQNDDSYDVFAIDCQHSEKSESVHNTYLTEQDAQSMLIESEDMNYDIEQIEQNNEDVDLAKERELLASL